MPKSDLYISHPIRRFASFLFIPLLSLLVFFIVQRIPALFTIEDLGLFLTVNGLLFGLLVSFTISRGWERVGILRSEVGNEISAYTHIVLVAENLADKKLYLKFIATIENYLKMVMVTNFKDYSRNKKLSAKFNRLFTLIKELKVKKQEDWSMVSSIIADIKAASNARRKQILAIESPMSHIRLEIIYFLSAVMLLGFFFSETQQELTGALTITAIFTVIALLLVLIHDLDNLSYQFGEVTNEEYARLLELFKEQKSKK